MGGWVDGFEFNYLVKISNKIPNLQSSASPISQTMATISQEIIRRMKNSSLDLPPSEIEKSLREYMDELKAGGYGELFIVQVLDAATKGFLKFWQNQCQGKSPINRPEASSKSLKR